MNEILKYTFTKENFEVRDGELILGEPTEITAYFTMKISGMSLFETEYGKPLIKTITNVLAHMDSESLKEINEFSQGGAGMSEESVERYLSVTEGILDSKLVQALASASYVKIDSGIPLNNIATVQEFKESEMYELCLSDFEFIGKLLTMAFQCINKQKRKKQETRKGKN